jgi:hypothetical protein
MSGEVIATIAEQLAARLRRWDTAACDSIPASAVLEAESVPSAASIAPLRGSSGGGHT